MVSIEDLMGNNRFGLTIEELYEEILKTLTELVVVYAKGDNPSAAISITAVYLTEVVKRWKTPGMTIEKIRAKAEEATNRQSRRWGMEELERLLPEEDNERNTSEDSNVRRPAGGRRAQTSSEQHGDAEADRASGDTLAPTEHAKAVGGDDSDSPDPNKGGGGDRTSTQQGAPGADRRDTKGGAEEVEREVSSGADDPGTDRGPGEEAGEGGVSETATHSTGLGDEGEPEGHSERGPKRDSERENEEEERGGVIVSTQCGRCNAPMPPSIDRGVGVKSSRSLPAAVRKCPACGWDPEAPAADVVAPKGRSHLGPSSAGKSFGGGKKRS